MLEKLRAFVERMVGVLGEENVVTLMTLDQLGAALDDIGELKEARKDSNVQCPNLWDNDSSTF